MPYNPGGIFSLVASYFASPGASIRTEQHNPVFEDVASALSNVLIRDGRAPMTGALNMNGFPINNVVAGSSPSSVATLAQAIPIGAVTDFAGSAAPSGWALCYGQALSRVTNAALFVIIGTTYGVGDGSTTFNLPDLRGRVSAGFDAMGGPAGNRLAGAVGAGLGVASVSLTANQVAPHTHSGTTGGMNANNPHFHPNNGFPSRGADGNNFSVLIPGGPSGAGVPSTVNVDIEHGHDFTTNTGNGVTGDQHTNVQPTLIMNKIIKVSYDG